MNNGFFIEAGADDFVGGSNRFANDAQWMMIVVVLIVLEIFNSYFNVPNPDSYKCINSDGARQNIAQFDV